MTLLYVDFLPLLFLMFTFLFDTCTQHSLQVKEASSNEVYEAESKAF